MYCLDIKRELKGSIMNRSTSDRIPLLGVWLELSYQVTIEWPSWTFQLLCPRQSNISLHYAWITKLQLYAVTNYAKNYPLWMTFPQTRLIKDSALILTRQLKLQLHITVHIDEQDLNIQCGHIYSYYNIIAKLMWIKPL